MAFVIIIIISFIYLKRRQRLQRATGSAIDSGRLTGDTRVKEALGTPTPFTLTSPFTISSKLQKKSLTESSPTVFSSITQPSTSLSANSEGRDTMVEMMQHMQEQLLHIQGRLLGERGQDLEGQRLWRINSNQNSENPFETHIESAADAPPPAYVRT
jgi:hypothetical protein